MKSILDTLPPETIETLITWRHSAKYTEVSARAALPPAQGGLNLRISPSTLSRLYTAHNIADSKEARAQYAASLGAECKKLRLLQATRENIEQRLFEMTARPDATVAELRLAAQFIQRADALSLSQRRVRVAEKREARIAEANAPKPPMTVEQADDAISVLLGKDFAKDSIPRANSANRAPASDSTNATRWGEAPAEPSPSDYPSHAPGPNVSPNSHSNIQSETSNLKSEISSPPQSKIVNHHFNSRSEHQVGAPDLKGLGSPSSIFNNQAELPPPSTQPIQTSSNQCGIIAPIPTHIMAHAERSYPSHLRPNCSILGPRWDWAKDHCIQSRLKFEHEAQLKAHTESTPSTA